MALYRRGTASMDADGTVHGTDTKWKDQLALIRVGATIVFLEQPIKLAVISDIVSDTELKAISTDGQTAADGKYVILLNDSLTVNGLAQNVAETLRYYQSREAEIAEAVELIKNLDMDKLNQIVADVNQAKYDAQDAQSQAELARDAANAARDEANSIKDQTQQIVDSAVDGINAAKDQAIADVGDKESAAVANIDKEEAAAIQAINDAKGDLSGYVTDAQAAAQTATSAKNDAQAARDASVSAKDAAAVSAQEAKDAAGSVNVDNLLTKSGNLDGITDAGEARGHLGLGSAATLNAGSATGDVMRVGDFGLGKPDGAYVFNTTSQDVLLSGLDTNGLCVFRNNQQIAAPWDIWNYSSSLFFRAGDTFSMISIPFEQAGKIKVFGGVEGYGWKTSRTIYDTVNTTVDTNGFIKTASPIVKVFKDGRFETNEQSEGAKVERISTGVYKVSGVLGLNSEALWGGVNGGFEIPVDVNKQPRIWLDYEVEHDGSIVVKTYHRTHDSSPSFASNKIEGFSNGDPIDIPSDAFVSIRVNMP